jgi:hypothetical protein
MGATSKKADNTITAKVIFFGEPVQTDVKDNLKFYKIDLFKEGEEDLITDSLDLLFGHEDIHFIERDNLFVNIKTKEIFIKNENGEKTKVIFKKKIDFFVLLYFIRHYEEILNISCLLDATCEEPELTKDSIIEASISSIRKTFQSMFGINPIKAFKKIGYQFSLA